MSKFTRPELRKIFEDAGIEVPPKDVLGTICELHTTAVDEITEGIDDLKSNLKKAEQERDALKDKVPEDGKEFVSKEKYDKVIKDFEEYKGGIEKKETTAKKSAAYKAILKEAGVDEKWISKIAKYSGEEIEKLELDEDGKAKDFNKLVEAAAKEHADYVVETHEGGADTHPHNNNGGNPETDLGKMSMADYIAARKGENK